MIINYNDAKNIFNYIIKKNYKIRRDENNIDILYIENNDKLIKCKYILVFTLEKNKLIWSYENTYFDQKTKIISKLIENNINLNINYKNLQSNELLKIINIILKNEKNIYFNTNLITPIWILSYNLFLPDQNKNLTQFFLITEIIYF
jgi:hypothetical protein